MKRWQLSVKALLDRAVGAGLLLATAPLQGACAIAVAASLGRPVLFRQERPGLHGKPFTLYKFRTMTEAKDGRGRPLPDGERLTAVGQFLRSTSLDELPQLWNVVRGELSLVGPRPLLVQYLDRYTARQARRHEVKPGMTGWAQVHGRNAVGWEERLERDVWYVEHWSLWLDAKILAMTVSQVLRRSGVARSGHATMPEFQGSDGRRGAA